MGYIIRDWRCEKCGRVAEKFTKREQTRAICLHCDPDEDAGWMHPIPSAPKIAYMRMGVDPAGCPTAAAKWAKAHPNPSKAPD